ncbi:MAG: hypothetical protein ACYSR7_04285, partial [Planctomycetota bacterium]
MKKTIMLSIVLCVAIISSPVLAYSVDVEILPEEVTIESGDFFDFQIFVRNDNNRDIELNFNVIGPHITWINQPDGMIVEARDLKTNIIRMKPVGEYPGVYEYNISVSSPTNSIETVVKNFTMNVINPVSIESMFVSNSADLLSIFPTLTSIKSHDGTITYNVFDANDNVVKTKTSSFSVDGEQRLSDTISIQYVLAGDYSVVANIDGT